MNDFDKIAPFYDFLAKLVFRDALRDIQLKHLSEIQPSDKVLILGGGTGHILKHIPPCDAIHFLEKSKKMLNRASQIEIAEKVEYLNSDFLTYSQGVNYDVILAPFFMDCFSESNLERVIDRCKSLLKTKGKLIVIDFDNGMSSKYLIKGMHFFFKVFANLESKRLLPINDFVISKRFKLESEKFSHRKRLFSRLYRNL